MRGRTGTGIQMAAGLLAAVEVGFRVSTHFGETRRS